MKGSRIFVLTELSIVHRHVLLALLASIERPKLVALEEKVSGDIEFISY